MGAPDAARDKFFIGIQLVLRYLSDQSCGFHCENIAPHGYFHLMITGSEAVPSESSDIFILRTLFLCSSSCINKLCFASNSNVKPPISFSILSAPLIFCIQQQYYIRRFVLHKLHTSIFPYRQYNQSSCLASRLIRKHYSSD